MYLSMLQAEIPLLIFHLVEIKPTVFKGVCAKTLFVIAQIWGWLGVEWMIIRAKTK